MTSRIALWAGANTGSVAAHRYGDRGAHRGWAAMQPAATRGKGLDLGTPFLPAARSGAGSCEVADTATGDALTIIPWILQLAAWALAALFIAGFTSNVHCGLHQQRPTQLMRQPSS